MTADLKGEISTATLEARLETLRADERECRQRVEDTAELASEALTRGEDADEAIRQQGEAVIRLSATQRAIKNLQEDLIPGCREAEARTAADKRVLGLKKSAGSLANEYTEDVERVENAAAALVEALQRLNERYSAITSRKVEALFLEDRFEDLEAPDLPDVPAPADALREVLARVQKLPVGRRAKLPPRLLSWREQQVAPLRSRVAATPTGSILAKAGYRPPGDMRTHDERHDEYQRNSRDRQDQQRRNAIAAVDGWLREQLNDGPRLKSAVESAAQAEGVRLHRDRNFPGQSIMEARQRLGVVVLRELSASAADGPSWLALPDMPWDGKRFVRQEVGAGLLKALRY